MFPQRLAELRKSRNLTQAEFAKIFNIATGTIGMWESGKREPNYEMIVKIADYFDVSVDYLLGRDSDSPIPEEPDELLFALYGETKELSKEDRQKILEFAKFIKYDAQKKK